MSPPSPFKSGEEEPLPRHLASRKWARAAVMIEAAWLWVRHQPKSALTCWFLERTAGQSKRVRKIMIVALARKLAIALLRFVELGLVPEGAILSARVTAKAR